MNWVFSNQIVIRLVCLAVIIMKCKWDVRGKIQAWLEDMNNPYMLKFFHTDSYCTRNGKYINQYEQYFKALISLKDN